MVKLAHERDLVGQNVVDFDERVDASRLRRERLARLQGEMAKADLGGMLLFDPVNVRYATGSRSSGVYNMRRFQRPALIPREGAPVLFGDMSGAEDSKELRIRKGQTWDFFPCGAYMEDAVQLWAANLKDVLVELGIASERIGLDKLDAVGFGAARAQEIELVDGWAPLERARAIKTRDELTLMRQAAAIADVAIDNVRRAIRPGVTEDELWSILAGTNLKYGGEHTDGKLLAAGGNTNPWFNDSTQRLVRPGDLVAFDIDMAGPMGYFLCVSRTYLCGDGKPNPEQLDAYKVAYEFIQESMHLFRPGMTYREISEKAYQFPEKYKAQRYPVMSHGAGMSDEWPAICYPDWSIHGFGHEPGALEENMVMTLECYVGKVGAREGVKLGEQMIITADGPEVISQASFDWRFLD
ncbi:MAG: aminopeptidase P family protein [Chloroflexi bacterium]|nr:aminopeptidase P family protein [Chloroflexota bacterium]